MAALTSAIDRLGQHIDVSMLEMMLTLTVDELQGAQFPVKQTRPADVRTGRNQGWICHACGGQRENVPGLDQATGHPEWVADPRFFKYSDRRKNWGDLMDGVESWSKALTT